jgi:hypothetical protein
MNEDIMGGACSLQGRDYKYRISGRKPEREETIWETQARIRNIKMDFKGIWRGNSCGLR